jgi:hypothetical protein
MNWISDNATAVDIEVDPQEGRAAKRTPLETSFRAVVKSERVKSD